VTNESTRPAGLCQLRLHEAPHEAGQARRCLREAGHGDQCWFWATKITPAMLLMLQNPPEPEWLGMFAGQRRTFAALRERGLLSVSHKRRGNTYVAHKTVVTRRGHALLNGKDVR
jgi:hypothetical protein